MIGGDESPPSTESTSITTSSIPDPQTPTTESEQPEPDIPPEVWDKTLTWENTLPQVNQLKSPGSQVFVRPDRSPNYVSREEPIQLHIRV